MIYRQCVLHALVRRLYYDVSVHQDFFGLMEYERNKRQIKRHTKFRAKHDIRGYDDNIGTVKMNKGTKVRFWLDDRGELDTGEGTKGGLMPLNSYERK